MNAGAGIGKKGQGLAAFIAMLLSLADHADRVSRRSIFVRIFVLWTLRRSESAMRSWFVGAGGICSPRTAMRLGDGAPTSGYSVDDALHLAALFRAMGKALTRLEARHLRRERNAALRAQRAAHNEIVIGPASAIPEILGSARLANTLQAMLASLNRPCPAHAVGTADCPFPPDTS